MSLPSPPVAPEELRPRPLVSLIPCALALSRSLSLSFYAAPRERDFQAERLRWLSEDNTVIKESEKQERAGDADREWDGREG